MLRGLLDPHTRAEQVGLFGGLDAFVGALRRHIDREEDGLFPAAAIRLDGPDWEEVDVPTPARVSS